MVEPWKKSFAYYYGQFIAIYERVHKQSKEKTIDDMREVIEEKEKHIPSK